MNLARRRKKEGFSLLEVMVAMAILGFALSVILSAQGGLSASNRSAANMGNAVNLGRCKMTELEERLLKLGYPEIDDLNSDVSCCDDDSGKFRCDTRVEKIIMPNPPSSNTGDGGALDLATPTGSASGGAGGAPGPINGLINPAGGATLDLDAGLANIGQALQKQTGAGGAGGMLNMVMGFVYPSMKIMMEASIRRLTVSVKWKEGPNERDMTIIQYVTNPQRGGFIAGVADGGSPGTSSTGGPGGSASPTSAPAFGK